MERLLSNQPFTVWFQQREDISLELRVENGKVLEMDGPQLKHRLLESQTARDVANKGTDPLIITRAPTQAN